MKIAQLILIKEKIFGSDFNRPNLNYLLTIHMSRLQLLTSSIIEHPV